MATSTMEWTREKTLLLINEYRKRRGLWDMTHDDYRKKEMKQKLLAEVSTTLGGNIPVAEVEKKFHTLRTQYHREINRMKRKEPYNSKWFGFKNLQFLSSPKACRSNKGRIKSEITEEGTVTTKYIIRETSEEPHVVSGGSPTSNANIDEEFITISRKPTILYEAVPATNAGGGSGGANATSRSHELEKLIEETTKDVEDIEESKPKMNIKEISVPLEHHHNAYNAQIHTSASTELTVAGEQDPLQSHNHHHQPMEEDDEQIETIDIQQATDEETAAFANSAAANGGAPGAGQGSIPTRIIKIQRRQDDYYENGHQQTAAHHNYSFQSGGGGASTPASTKRIYYDGNGHQHTATILTTPTGSVTTSPVASGALIGSNVKVNQSVSRNCLPQKSAQSPQHPLQRDEFTTYGEYVANEMRNISNREILTELKQRINTALFEATMAELQK